MPRNDAQQVSLSHRTSQPPSLPSNSTYRAKSSYCPLKFNPPAALPGALWYGSIRGASKQKEGQPRPRGMICSTTTENIRNMVASLTVSPPAIWKVATDCALRMPKSNLSSHGSGICRFVTDMVTYFPHPIVGRRLPRKNTACGFLK